jgi:hypothetical protein
VRVVAGERWRVQIGWQGGRQPNRGLDGRCLLSLKMQYILN